MRFLRANASLFIICLLGGAARLYALGELPGGFYRDEAFYALDAADILAGRLALFFEANNGREPLFIYVMAAVLGMFGHSVFAARLTSALLGTLTLPAIYFAGRQLLSHRVGVLASGVMSGLFWHLAISRVAYRAISLPLLLCLAFGLWAMALRQPKNRRLAPIAGATIGACFYTYTSAQMALALIFALSLTALFFGQDRRARLAQISRIWLIAIAVMAPLLLWLMNHPQYIAGRAAQVSVLNPAINHGDLASALWTNLGRSTEMWLNSGDRIWRHNLALRPVFEPLLGTCFFMGLIVLALRAFRGQRTAWVLLAWFMLMQLPTVLAEDTPHFLRAIGALPAACLVAATGMEAGLAWLSRRGYFMQIAMLTRGKISPPALIATLLLALAANSTRVDYFDDYARRAVTQYWLEAQTPALAAQINQSLLARTVYVDQRLIENLPGLGFLAPQTLEAAVAFQPAALAFAAPGDYYFDPKQDFGALRAALPATATIHCRMGALAQADLDAKPSVAFASYSIQPSSQELSPTYRFGAEAELVKWDSVGNRTLGIAPAGFNLIWQAQHPITEELTVFVHWLKNGQLLAQHDGPPCDGLLPATAWRAGQFVGDVHLAQGDSSAADEVRVGVYRSHDKARLLVIDASATQLGDSVIIWKQ